MTPSSDSEFMARALVLAERGRGRVEPNPVVGALVVRGGEVAGQGWHERFGGPHAEVNAIRAAERARRGAARGATMYVTLAPCCTQGKTPPCTEAVIRAGLARVVVGAADPTQPEGVAQLRAAGIDVAEGMLGDECRDQNAPFFKLRLRGLPYVIAKWAMTLDGRIATATGDSRWISCEESRRRVHELRNRVDAVLIGIGTALRDDPLLTCRLPGGRNPRRVVLDSRARLSLESALVRSVQDAELLVASAEDAPEDRVAALQEAGCRTLALPAEHGRVSLTALMQALGRMELTNVLVEGGRDVFTAAFRARLVDEVWVFVAHKIVGAGRAPVGDLQVERMAEALALSGRAIEPSGTDTFIRARSCREGGR